MQKKRSLFIIGAGGLGREAESLLETTPDYNIMWQIKGYLDDSQETGIIKDYPSDYQILGNIKNYPLTKDDFVLIAIADPEGKENVYNYLKEKTTIYTLISPSVFIGKFVFIGEGSIIGPYAGIGPNVNIGKCVLINAGTHIGHDVKIDDYCSLMANVNIGGKCIIGKKVFAGTNATIAPGKIITDEVKISVGSMVINNVNSKSIIYGNPAKKI